MKLLAAVLAVIAIALIVVACGGGGGIEVVSDDERVGRRATLDRELDGNSPQADEALNENQPETKAAATDVLPTPPLTGITSIDTAVDAVLRQDADALTAQIQLNPVPCEETPVDLSPLPACDGEPEGTLFQRFPVAGCGSVYTTREGAEQTLRGRITAGEFMVIVYAVYHARGSRFVAGTDSASDFFWRAKAAYVVVIDRQIAQNQTTNSSGAYVLLLNNAGVVGYFGGCGSPPEFYIDGWGLTDAIIPPPDER